MPSFRIRALLAACLILAGTATLWMGTSHAEPRRHASLLEMLAEWRYPESQPLEGVTLSDGATLRGGVRTVSSSRCHTILTTPDSFEKVVEYYVKKLGITEPGQPDAIPGDAPSGGQSVFSQDDSKRRPFLLRIISVNRDNSATTLVISRADGEQQTHIAWTHYLR
jgi:hypothetical protein